MVCRPELERARAALRPLGFTLDAGPIPFAIGTPRERELHRISRVDDGALTVIDLMIVTPILEASWESRIEARWRGRSLWCVSLEGLGRMKRLAARPQDIADLENLGLATTSGEEGEP